MKGADSFHRGFGRAYAQQMREQRVARRAAERRPAPLAPRPTPEQWTRALAETGGKTIAAAELIAQWNAVEQNSKP